MTELEVKDLILKRMTDIIPNATSVDMSYMAGTLKTLESLGKPDSTDKYFDSLTDIMKIMNDRKNEENETLKNLLEKYNKPKEVSDERV